MTDLFVISAPSGTGKTTLVKKILSEVPRCFRSVSVTTRSPRPDEIDGVDYRFVSQETFQKMIERGDFFEWEEIHGALYGTPRSELEKARAGSGRLILDIDTRGAEDIKKAYPESCLIFLKPPSEKVLEERLRARKTEKESSLRRRLEAAQSELAKQDRYDYVIINDDLNQAFLEIKKIIEKGPH